MRFRKPSRVRRVDKWLGLTLCLLIGIVWAESLRWYGVYGMERDSIGVESGRVKIWSNVKRASKAWVATRPGLHWNRTIGLHNDW